MARLDRLAEWGLQIVEAIAAQAQGGDPVVADVAMAYTRVSRAVRLTILLRARLRQDAGVARKLEAETAKAARKGRIEGIVTRVICDGLDDTDEAVRQVETARDLIDDEDIYGDVMIRPISELVAEICHDLGFDPDWALLSNEAWAKAEMAATPGEPLAAFMAAFSGAGPPKRARPEPSSSIGTSKKRNHPAHQEIEPGFESREGS